MFNPNSLLLLLSELFSKVITAVITEVITPPVLTGIALIGGWLVGLLALAEWLYRRGVLPSEMSRKLVHIGTGQVVPLAWWFGIPGWVGIAAAIVAAAIAIISHWQAILPSVNGVGRKTWGTLFYAISIGVSMGWFFAIGQPHIAALGIGVMAWGDGFAAIVGQRWGRHPYQLWGMGKSWEGSLTMFAVSFLVCSFFLALGEPGQADLIANSNLQNLEEIASIAAIVALVAMTLEAFSKWGVDNLTVPIGCAIVALFLQNCWLV